jgi:hypothetical protein
VGGGGRRDEKKVRPSRGIGVEKAGRGTGAGPALVKGIPCRLETRERGWGLTKIAWVRLAEGCSICNERGFSGDGAGDRGGQPRAQVRPCPTVGRAWEKRQERQRSAGAGDEGSGQRTGRDSRAGAPPVLPYTSALCLLTFLVEDARSSVLDGRTGRSPGRVERVQ